MTRRARLWLGALFLTGEVLILVTHWEEARAMQRTIYQTLWKFTPKRAGYVVPDRFAPR